MSANVNPTTVANPYAPPRATVRDITASATSIVLAERSTRLAASIVDGLIFSGMVYIPMLVGFAISGAGAGSNPNTAFPLIGVGIGLVAFVVWAWLTLKNMSATGQSLAKKHFNIKVVRSDGSPASLATLIMKRNILTWVLSIIPLYSLIELLFIFSEKRQCLHDRMADTIVVIS